MLTKLQIIFGVAAGVMLFIFLVAVVTVSKQAPSQQAAVGSGKPEPAPSWLAIVAWTTFGVCGVAAVGTMATIVVDEYRKEHPREEDEAAEHAEATAEHAGAHAEGLAEPFGDEHAEHADLGGEHVEHEAAGGFGADGLPELGHDAGESHFADFESFEPTEALEELPHDDLPAD